MIRFELFYLQCMTSNINWQSRTIKIRNNIKYIHTTIKHFHFPDTDLKEKATLPFITYNDISRIWLTNLDKYSKLFHIDFKKLVLGSDYSLAPIYLYRDVNNRDINNSNIIIGIFLFSSIPESKEISNKTISNNIIVTSHIFLSAIKPNILSTRQCDINKYNILSGILNYQNEMAKCEKCETNTYLEIGKNKLLWNHIFINARNYLPKLEISIIE
uniref:Uncharacterized protein n=1 Tax=viral metagenome TaxID=1070528 RepID=A0A6C0F117_9ZZZZ